MTAFANNNKARNFYQTMVQGLPSRQDDKNGNTASRPVSPLLFIAARNGLAMLGLMIVIIALTVSLHGGLRETGEGLLMDWLQTVRFGAATDEPPPSSTVGRATVSDPQTLSAQQAAVTMWLARRYRVAPEPMAALVREAYQIGRRNRLDPLLLLSVMAVESGFNPFAQSPVGAQGLMQVMTDIHSEKYEPFGGQYAAFDPLTNLQVGARVLQDYIRRTGSVEGGLRRYVGAANLPTDGGYVAKVLGEHRLLNRVTRNMQPNALPDGTLDAPKPIVRAKTLQSAQAQQALKQTVALN
jgi:hypothetical protein